MICKKCGRELPEGARFCVACGTPVQPIEEYARPAAAPAAAAGAAADAASQAAQPAADTAAQAVQSAADTAAQAVQSDADTAAQAVQPAADTAAQAVQSAADTAAQAAQSASAATQSAAAAGAPFSRPVADAVTAAQASSYTAQGAQQQAATAHAQPAQFSYNYGNQAPPPAKPAAGDKTPAMQPPIGVGSFMLMELVGMIPIINVIVLLIWSFSDGGNLNRRNWARARLIWVAVGIAASIIILVFLIMALYQVNGQISLNDFWNQLIRSLGTV